VLWVCGCCGVGILTVKSIRLLAHDAGDSSSGTSGMQGTSEENSILSVNLVENHRGRKIKKC